MIGKKAQSIMDVFILIIILFVAVAFFGAFIYGFSFINTALATTETPANDLGINISKEAGNTFGYVAAGYGILPVIALFMVFGMFLSILISNFLIKAHPVFLIIYIFVSIIAVVFAVPISNAYESALLGNPDMASTFGGFKAVGYILLHLPLVIAIIGIVGSFLLFSGILRDKGAGGGI